MSKSLKQYLRCGKIAHDLICTEETCLMSKLDFDLAGLGPVGGAQPIRGTRLSCPFPLSLPPCHVPSVVLVTALCPGIMMPTDQHLPLVSVHSSPEHHPPFFLTFLNPTSPPGSLPSCSRESEAHHLASVTRSRLLIRHSLPWTVTGWRAVS